METVYLDTHIIAWLHNGSIDKLSAESAQLIQESNHLAVSSMVVLELGYLHEIGRVGYEPKLIIDELSVALGLYVRDVEFKLLVTQALELSWTRDPFDRLIAAQAYLDDAKLVTKDKTIRQHYKKAVW